ncbi:hypothetical protein UY3_06735 [Chelonia mydas]|uniref:Uncharacterized protein n=1 Tax=Chelonia mydas TaxID=8469 RepID=M7BDQ7_CHEMY|nr:hypothetical protein UY3_06735 [Chelonia mydas]
MGASGVVPTGKGSVQPLRDMLVTSGSGGPEELSPGLDRLFGCGLTGPQARYEVVENVDNIKKKRGEQKMDLGKMLKREMDQQEQWQQQTQFLLAAQQQQQAFQKQQQLITELAAQQTD